MEKIVVISCTNRAQSNTLRVSRIYQRLLTERKIKNDLFDLRQLPPDISFSDTGKKRSTELERLIERFLLPNQRFIFVMPEYNGSFPGILKVFIDATHPREWENKHACLVGVADGRAGNLRGLEHLTGILHYMRVHVYHDKLPISAITKIMNDTGEFVSETQLRACIRQLEGFLKC